MPVGCIKYIYLCSRNTLEHIDLEMDKTVEAFSSQYSMSDVSRRSSAFKISDKVLIFLKYFSNFVHKGARIVINILNRGTQSIDPSDLF